LVDARRAIELAVGYEPQPMTVIELPDVEQSEPMLASTGIAKLDEIGFLFLLVFTAVRDTSLNAIH